ncbi:YjjG family noncanonical pyrimidine nucleotidase [Arcticibacterium luteifluviistationis]|uniref:YjjG family noncanonical pyrimidine nucleotidase n=1 Tax=Arcticibacterium luteifluviistationis TaxID=1784714 RepID=UPI0013A6A0EF|nr:YjjG family noncanonical pyrimidine nucleotidase [Arcticibacterium luteifluviistationis]
MFKHKKHIFFDLDHTLWDFESNAEESLKEIYDDFSISKLGPSFGNFYQNFSKLNRLLWTQLEQEIITHETIRMFRFQKALSSLNVEIDKEQSIAMNLKFLDLLPNKTKLIDGCQETLEALQAKYQLHILSNGYAEVQAKKLEHSGIKGYFQHIITNDIAASRKPNVGIFNYALEKSNSQASQSLMIGDSYLADILGAKNAGWDTVHFQPSGIDTENQSTLKITKLVQLLDHL